MRQQKLSKVEVQSWLSGRTRIQISVCHSLSSDWVANMKGASGEVLCEDIKMAGIGGGGLDDVGMNFRST